MKSLLYSIVIAALALAIAPSFSFGQVVYNTGTQGCCDLLDSHYTLVAAPPGVPLGNVYSTTLCGCWVAALPGSWWISPSGAFDNEPVGDYTFRQTFTLESIAGASLTGRFAADDSSCVSLNGGPAQCTPGGQGGYEHYTNFEFTTGFQVGTNTLDYVVHNVVFAIALEVVISGPATEKKLHNFGIDSRDGTGPQAGLISDAAGNLYGTTKTGGTYSSGTVFELSPTEGGGWTEKKLHNFGIDEKDGTQPMAGLIFDAAGKLYGTTYQGGDYNGGTVFELTPTQGGGWTEKKLHNFGIHSTDGVQPMAGLIFDAAGHLYGTTYQGGDYNAGTVFELTPTEGGVWSEKKLHNFGLTEKDGIYPRGNLIFNAAGNLYGTTYEGGSGPCSSGCGTVFALTPNGSGGWIERRLHNFGITSTDGIYPMAGLFLNAAGDLYGTTYQGGDYSAGTVFEVTPQPHGGWIEKKLHNFGINDKDGTRPMAGLSSDDAGNLFGTTYQGGDYNNGTVFELTPNGSGGWTERKLHNFGINETDATLPQSGLIFDAAGNLYGTTTSGGAYGGGTVFEIAR